MFGVSLKNKIITMTVEIDEEVDRSSFVGDEGTFKSLFFIVNDPFRNNY